MERVRLPTQAGAFYEAGAESLNRQIQSCFLNQYGPRKLPEVSRSSLRHVVGLVCPHAGYMFSGPVAAHSYAKLASDGKPDTVVVLGPNHTGYGSGLAIMSEGAWRTPLGDVEVDKETANQVVKRTRIVDIDDLAHSYEHSIEVQLPFLQFLYGSEFKIVPVCFLMQDLSSAREVGAVIGSVLADKNAVVIASSDMSHHEDQDRASTYDRLALKAVEAMDEAEFYSVVEKHNISACGYGPIAALIVAAKAMGAKEAKILCYRTSGDVIGDYSSVVGYAAMCFAK